LLRSCWNNMRVSTATLAEDGANNIDVLTVVLLVLVVVEEDTSGKA